MRLITFVFWVFLSGIALAQSNGETGVLIRPASLGEIEKLLDLTANPPVGICDEDYVLAFWLLMNDEKVFLENSNDGTLIPIYKDRFILRINERQALFPIYCEE